MNTSVDVEDYNIIPIQNNTEIISRGFQGYYDDEWFGDEYSGPWPVPLYVDDHQYLSVVHAEVTRVEQVSTSGPMQRANHDHQYSIDLHLEHYQLYDIIGLYKSFVLPGFVYSVLW